MIRECTGAYRQVAAYLYKAIRNRKQSGQSLGEYGLILALIAVVCIASLQLLGQSITTLLTDSVTTISNAVFGAMAAS